jgi:hypothetical protein
MTFSVAVSVSPAWLVTVQVTVVVPMAKVPADGEQLRVTALCGSPTSTAGPGSTLAPSGPVASAVMSLVVIDGLLVSTLKLFDWTASALPAASLLAA